jgi:hypothetical protein
MAEQQKPNAGDVVLVRNETFLSPIWQIGRIVKVGKVMWEIEPYSQRGEWGEPRKRKVEAFVFFKGDVAQASQRLMSAEAHRNKVKKDADANYNATVAKIAGGASD